MRNLMKRGQDFLHREQREHASKVVIYERIIDEASHRCQPAAVVGNTQFETLEEAANIWQKTESRDFLIICSDLRIQGDQTEPRAGDRIHERHGKTTIIYEVNAPGNARCFEYDKMHNRYRIHTKEMDSY